MTIRSLVLPLSKEEEGADLEKNPLDKLSDWLSSWSSSFGGLQERFGTIGAVLLIALAAGVLSWWYWEDIARRPGIRRLVGRSTRDGNNLSQSVKFAATVIPLVESETKAAITHPERLQLQGTGHVLYRTDGLEGKLAAPGEPDRSLYSLVYRYRRIPKGYYIDYRLPYLDLLQASGPISGVRYETSPFLSTFPQVRAAIANNTAQQTIVTAVCLDIEKSEQRREVVLTVDYGSTNTLVLVNHAWADVEDATLIFSIDRARPEDAEPASIELRLGTFGASKVIPIVKYIPRELARSDAAEVNGEIWYRSAGQLRKVKFTTTVRLNTTYGKSLPPSEAYDLFFSSGELGRVVAELPIAHQIKPGDAEALDLRISTDRSSITTMKLSFLTSEGDEIPANTLTLELFVPRFSGLQLRRRANKGKD